MKYLLLLTFVNLIFKVNGIDVDKRAVLFEKVIPLIQDIISFYNSFGVYFVFESHIDDCNLDLKTWENTAVRWLSRMYIMSQVIDYNNLEEMSQKHRRGYSRSPLFVIFVEDTKSLEHFRNSIRNSDISAYSWFALIGESTGIDCKNPQGNPLNLKMDTRMIANCQKSWNIMKYYSIFENTTEAVQLAVWAPGSHLIIESDDNVLQVKKNMKGIALRGAVRPATSAAYNQNWKNYLTKLKAELENVANFTINVTVNDDSCGYQDEDTKKWFGLMKAMSENRADIVIALLSMSNTRLQVVDFTIPLMTTHVHLYARLPNSTNIQWSAYFRVFDKYSWMALGLTVLILSAVLGLTKNKMQRPYFNSRTYLENFINVWGIYTQQGLPEPPNNQASQMLCFWILLSSLFINALYSASITSYITVLTTVLPFSTIDEFLNSDYQLIILNGSRGEDLILHGDPLVGVLKEHLRTNKPMPVQPYEGFQQACREKIAFYSNEVSFSGSNQILSCVLGSLQLPRIEWMSLALAKDSPYTETLNYYILRLMNNGIMQRLKSKYLYKYEELTDSNPNYVTLWEVMPILAILLIGVITALLVLCLEVRVHNYCRSIPKHPAVKSNIKPRIAWK
ncbi:glutamate [NMDA] receptor subunit 1-like [Nasonia vitripennis]|uniref:Uncharacterized protein n=1 Tax=Nasonia vitripennis TaxID=7425 RepID=A0A7M7IL91_NASVI|nr:glutamate [NMDA] receptor subunit 1-like [Nasonia vitripennis]